MVESSLFMPCRTLVISSIMRFSPLFVGFDDVDNLLHFRILDAVIVHHAGGCRLEGSLVHVLDEGDSQFVLCSFDSRIDLIFPGQDLWAATSGTTGTRPSGRFCPGCAKAEPTPEPPKSAGLFNKAARRNMTYKIRDLFEQSMLSKAPDVFCICVLCAVWRRLFTGRLPFWSQKIPGIRTAIHIPPAKERAFAARA